MSRAKETLESIMQVFLLLTILSFICLTIGAVVMVVMIMLLQVGTEFITYIATIQPQQENIVMFAAAYIIGVTILCRWYYFETRSDQEVADNMNQVVRTTEEIEEHNTDEEIELWSCEICGNVFTTEIEEYGTPVDALSHGLQHEVDTATYRNQQKVKQYK